MMFQFDFFDEKRMPLKSHSTGKRLCGMQWPGTARLHNRQRDSVRPRLIQHSRWRAGSRLRHARGHAVWSGSQRTLHLARSHRQVAQHCPALFGGLDQGPVWTLIEFSWRRIGTRGQSRTVSFAQGSEAERFIALLLRRRAGAPRRIGVAYREVTPLAKALTGAGDRAPRARHRRPSVRPTRPAQARARLARPCVWSPQARGPVRHG